MEYTLFVITKNYSKVLESISMILMGEAYKPLPFSVSSDSMDDTLHLAQVYMENPEFEVVRMVLKRFDATLETWTLQLNGEWFVVKY